MSRTEDVGVALLDSADIAVVFSGNSVEDVSSVPNAPVYEWWHSGTDVLIPVEAIDSTMARYCEAGVPVTSDAVSAPDHLSAAVIGQGAGNLRLAFYGDLMRIDHRWLSDMEIERSRERTRLLRDRPRRHHYVPQMYLRRWQPDSR
ncbi:lipase family protein [Rhodococcus erythropolis]|nr:lipase family protein [Rhodococcus erythropolis]